MILHITLTAATEVKYTAEFESTMDTPYLTVKAELWGVLIGGYGENKSCYNGPLLYHGDLHIWKDDPYI